MGNESRSVKKIKLLQEKDAQGYVIELEKMNHNDIGPRILVEQLRAENINCHIRTDTKENACNIVIYANGNNPNIETIYNVLSNIDCESIINSHPLINHDTRNLTDFGANFIQDATIVVMKCEDIDTYRYMEKDTQLITEKDDGIFSSVALKGCRSMLYAYTAKNYDQLSSAQVEKIFNCIDSLEQMIHIREKMGLDPETVGKATSINRLTKECLTQLEEKSTLYIPSGYKGHANYASIEKTDTGYKYIICDAGPETITWFKRDEKKWGPVLREYDIKDPDTIEDLVKTILEKKYQEYESEVYNDCQTKIYSLVDIDSMKCLTEPLQRRGNCTTRNLRTMLKFALEGEEIEKDGQSIKLSDDLRDFVTHPLYDKEYILEMLDSTAARAHKNVDALLAQAMNDGQVQCHHKADSLQEGSIIISGKPEVLSDIATILLEDDIHAESIRGANGHKLLIKSDSLAKAVGYFNSILEKDTRDDNQHRAMLQEKFAPLIAMDTLLQMSDEGRISTHTSMLDDSKKIMHIRGTQEQLDIVASSLSSQSIEYKTSMAANWKDGVANWSNHLTLTGENAQQAIELIKQLHHEKEPNQTIAGAALQFGRY